MNLSELSFKQKLIGFIVAIGIALIVLVQMGFGSSPADPTRKEPEVVNSDEGVRVLSTNPSPLDGATILPNQNLEIVFNQPMVNDPARIKLEPDMKYNASVSGDHKTLKVEPLEPFKLGQGYRLTISAGYASDNGKKTGEDLMFNFKTIDYNGV